MTTNAPIISYVFSTVLVAAFLGVVLIQNLYFSKKTGPEKKQTIRNTILTAIAAQILITVYWFLKFN